MHLGLRTLDFVLCFVARVPSPLSSKPHPHFGFGFRDRKKESLARGTHPHPHHRAHGPQYPARGSPRRAPYSIPLALQRCPASTTPAARRASCVSFLP